MAEANPWADGMGFSDPKATVVHPGVMPGRVLHFLAQEGIVPNPDNWAVNEALGLVKLPIKNVGQKGTVTVSNAIYTSLSILVPWAINANADGGPLGLSLWLDQKYVSPSQFVLGYSPIAANMTQEWWAGYLILGNK